MKNYCIYWLLKRTLPSQCSLSPGSFQHHMMPMRCSFDLLNSIKRLTIGIFPFYWIIEYIFFRAVSTWWEQSVTTWRIFYGIGELFKNMRPVRAIPHHTYHFNLFLLKHCFLSHKNMRKNEQRSSESWITYAQNYIV